MTSGIWNLGWDPPDNRKDSVSAFQKRLVRAGIDRFMVGEEAAADHEQDRAAIGLFRLENVEREGSAKLASVNHICHRAE